MKDTAVGWALIVIASGGMVLALGQTWLSYWIGMAMLAGPLVALFIIDNWPNNWPGGGR